MYQVQEQTLYRLKNTLIYLSFQEIVRDIMNFLESEVHVELARKLLSLYKNNQKMDSCLKEIKRRRNISSNGNGIFLGKPPLQLEFQGFPLYNGNKVSSEVGLSISFELEIGDCAPDLCGLDVIVLSPRNEHVQVEYDCLMERIYSITFTPDEEGEYEIRLGWEGIILQPYFYRVEVTCQNKS